MNYRHAFHAGNFADVLKHATLTLVIEHLKLKPAPFRVIDTHAGTGLYDLTSSEAQRTGEWLAGIGRLMGPGPLPPTIADLLQPYLESVRGQNPVAVDEIRTYPGSPALALSLMRSGDRLIANELHPEDRRALEAAIDRDSRAKVMGIDGWQALKALLPPRERRGAVLIDPPFEQPGELERLAEGLQEALQRFATGIYLLWLPVKDTRQAQRFYAAVANSGASKALLAELSIRSIGTGGLTATAIVVVNPPYRLDEKLRTLLPFLAERLAQGQGANHRLNWLIGSA